MDYVILMKYFILTEYLISNIQLLINGVRHIMLFPIQNDILKSTKKRAIHKYQSLWHSLFNYEKISQNCTFSETLNSSVEIGLIEPIFEHIIMVIIKWIDFHSIVLLLVWNTFDYKFMHNLPICLYFMKV